MPPTVRRPPALRVLSAVAALALAAAGVALFTGGVAPEAPEHLRVTAGVVVVLLAVYRAALALAPRGR